MNIEKALGTSVALSPLMAQRQALFRAITSGRAPWNDEQIRPLMLAGAISAEVSRKVAGGLVSEICPVDSESNPARAAFLNAQYLRLKERLREVVFAACNDGEIILKPYLSPSGVETLICQTDCYLPLGYNRRGELVDVVFAADAQSDKTRYKLLERHTYDESTRTHSITFHAFKKPLSAGEPTADSLGSPADLSEIPEWAGLTDLTIFETDAPLFSHFRLPSSDVVESPQLQGLPVWSKAVGQLECADRHEARTEWEFKGGELAVFASADMFRPTARRRDGALLPLELPEGGDRRFITLDVAGEDFQIKEYAPDLRFPSLEARMNQILRRIEFLSGLSYGIISDANGQDRTAEEFRSSKDRFFTTVCDLQHALEAALRRLAEAMNTLADLLNVPQGEYNITFTWDDSIVADRQREFDERKQLVQLGVMTKREFYDWYICG